jgi:hypothetical protein
MTSQQALQLSSPKSSHNMSSQESVHQDETGEVYLRRKLKEWYSSDRPKGNCDGRANDNKLLPTYSTFEFQLATASKDEIQRLWNGNCEDMEKHRDKPERPKEAVRIGLFIGAPGIGKTRTLLELKTIVPCRENYVYVSFNGITPSAPKEKHATFDQMIAIRILWGSFERWNSSTSITFKQWATKFDYEKEFTTIDCLEIIRKEKGPFCLAIDEISRLDEMAQRACNEITELVLTSQTIVFLGGTLRNDWEVALTRSSIPAKFLSLAPLNNAQVSSILDTLQPPYAKYFNGWRTNTHLRDLLLQIGGVPRLLDDFVRMCDKEFKDRSPPWDWKQMDASLKQNDRITALRPEILSRLVKDIVLRKQVSRMGHVIKEDSGEPRTTYDRLQSQGFIQLLQGDSEGSCVIFVPFVRFRGWVTTLKTLADQGVSFKILNDFMALKVEWGYWIDFEKVTAQYFQLLIYMWSEEAEREPQNPVTWETFFTMDIPGWHNNVQFIDGSPDVVTCYENDKYKFDDGSVFINAASASFADVFFTCRHGKQRTKCLVAIQCKLLEKTAMSKRILNEEVGKNGDAMKDYREAFGDCSDMLTVILVTAPYTDHDQGESSKSTAVDRPMTRKRAMEADKPKEVHTYIVLDRIHLQRFFPQPLRDYTFRSISSGRLNINCAPLDDVKKLFGLNERQAKAFAEKRKSTGGFASTAELPFKVGPDQSALIEF